MVLYDSKKGITSSRTILLVNPVKPVQTKNDNHKDNDISVHTSERDIVSLF